MQGRSASIEKTLRQGITDPGRGTRLAGGGDALSLPAGRQRLRASTKRAPATATIFRTPGRAAVQKSLGRLAFNTEFCPAAYLIAEKIIERYAPGITK
ncbi:MAG: hypothetical protein MZU95_10325 [Desulfomicrobium escambiense]|nr:hypothetical protein [Desulfomicrobium escambiense]